MYEKEDNGGISGYEAYEVKQKRENLCCLLLRRKKIFFFIFMMRLHGKNKKKSSANQYSCARTWTHFMGERHLPCDRLMYMQVTGEQTEESDADRVCH